LEPEHIPLAGSDVYKRRCLLPCVRVSMRLGFLCFGVSAGWLAAVCICKSVD